MDEPIPGKPPKIIVALDGITEHFALMLANEISKINGIWGFKVNDLLVRYGTDVIFKLSKYSNVMADPKFFDIPNTVANGVSRLADAGASIITVHAMGGNEMMTAAVQVAKKCKSEIAAVTVLTSADKNEHEVLFTKSREYVASELMRKAVACGVTHIVSSGDVAAETRHVGLKSIVPGIRFDTGPKIEDDDQKQVTKKFNQYLDYVVIGRPIIADADPVNAAFRIRDEIHDAYCRSVSTQ